MLARTLSLSLQQPLAETASGPTACCFAFLSLCCDYYVNSASLSAGFWVSRHEQVVRVRMRAPEAAAVCCVRCCGICSRANRAARCSRSGSVALVWTQAGRVSPARTQTSAESTTGPSVVAAVSTDIDGNGCICVEPVRCAADAAPIGPGTEGAARVLCAIGVVASALEQTVQPDATQWL